MLYNNARTKQRHAGVIQTMILSSDPELGSDAVVEIQDSRIAIFDIEVYPNLFVICWKFRGDDEVVRMINPTRQRLKP
jgi:hypothetical protein